VCLDIARREVHLLHQLANYSIDLTPHVFLSRHLFFPVLNCSVRLKGLTGRTNCVEPVGAQTGSTIDAITLPASGMRQARFSSPIALGGNALVEALDLLANRSELLDNFTQTFCCPLNQPFAQTQCIFQHQRTIEFSSRTCPFSSFS